MLHVNMLVMSNARKNSRLYGGVAIEERRAERHLRLIDAAIKVYGEVGYRNATVKAVCEAAQLTERYFYESFANSEALLVATYTHVTDHLHAEMATAGAQYAGNDEQRIAAVLKLYFTRLQEHPRQARVFLLEIAGIGPAVDVVRMEAVKAMSNILLPPSVPSRRDAKDAPACLLTIGMIGAVISIALRWVSHDYPQPIGEVVAAAAAFCRVSLPDTQTVVSIAGRRSATARKR